MCAVAQIRSQDNDGLHIQTVVVALHARHVSYGDKSRREGTYSD